MKRKSSAQRRSNALGLSIFIGSLIGLLVLVALLVKIILLFSQSTFDGKHQYVIDIIEPHQSRFIVFNPDNQTVRTLLIHGDIAKHPEMTLGIPIDATAQTTEDINAPDTLTNTLLFQKSSIHATANLIDAIVLFIFMHTTDTGKVVSQDMSLATDPTTQNNTFSSIFLDNTIYKEGKSIAIVNGADVPGLGTKVSGLFTHIGGNVVSITSADKPIAKSSISYVGESSYTVERLTHLLHIPAVHLPGIAISDITVTLGTDKANMFTSL